MPKQWWQCFRPFRRGERDGPNWKWCRTRTRQQELIDDYEQLSEDQKRLAIRSELITHNKSLAEAARGAGVVKPVDYAIFQNKGYQRLATRREDKPNRINNACLFLEMDILYYYIVVTYKGAYRCDMLPFIIIFYIIISPLVL